MSLPEPKDAFKIIGTLTGGYGGEGTMLPELGLIRSFLLVLRPPSPKRPLPKP